MGERLGEPCSDGAAAAHSARPRGLESHARSGPERCRTTSERLGPMDTPVAVRVAGFIGPGWPTHRVSYVAADSVRGVLLFTPYPTVDVPFGGLLHGETRAAT